MAALKSQPRPITTIDIQNRLVNTQNRTATADEATLTRSSERGSVFHPQVNLFITAIESDTRDESYIIELHQSDDAFSSDDDLLGTLELVSAGANDLDEIILKAQVFNTRAITKTSLRIVIAITGTIATGITYSAYYTSR